MTTMFIVSQGTCMSFGFVQNDESLFEQFGEELAESGRLPFGQIINPGSKVAKTLDKDPLSYGFAISQENAEQVNFQLDAHWVYGEDIPIHPLSKAVITGYVAHALNVVCIASSDLEVQEKTDKSWRFRGLAYENRKLTQWGEIYQDNRENKESPYRQVRRFLLLFLGDDGKPLMESPIQYTGNGAFGLSFHQELNDFYKEVGSAYKADGVAKGHRISGSTLTKAQQPYVVVPLTVGYFVPDESDRSAFACVTARPQPVFKATDIGVKGEIKRRDRIVHVVGNYYRDFMIPRGCDLGQLINSLVQEHQSFGEPGRGLHSEESGSRTEVYEGYWDLPTQRVNGDNTFCSLVTDTASIPVSMTSDWAWLLDCDRVRVTGTVPADGGSLVLTDGGAALDATDEGSSLVNEF
jgi:hypothetical protein